jgi:hypothetical protein
MAAALRMLVRPLRLVLGGVVGVLGFIERCAMIGPRHRRGDSYRTHENDMKRRLRNR